MAKKAKKTPPKISEAQIVSGYFSSLLNVVATIYLALTVVVLPMYMSREKYTAVTAAKSGFFSTVTTIVWIFMILLLTSYFLYATDTKPKGGGKSLSFRQKIIDNPPLLADIAIIAYWVLMLISCLLSEDRHTAFFGLEPRDNGFIYQTYYVAGYFIISRAMKPANWKAMLFVWGGAILGIVCILHYYGVDIYDMVTYYTLNEHGEWVERKLAEKYAGPFWTTSYYRFLGPVGNVNLGSYILSAALVIAAGLYITGVQPDFFRFRSIYSETDSKGNRKLQIPFAPCKDKYGINLLVCFVITLFAELNINTDAGLVAMAAAVLIIPIVLCGTLDRFCRALVIFAAAALTVFADQAVDTTLRQEEFGTTIKVLRIVTLLLIVLAVVGMLVKNRESVRRFATTKRLRIALSCVMALAVIGGIALSLVITKPDGTAAGSISGASATLTQVDLKEKSDTIVHELGQMLRGNFDDHFGHNRLFTWKRTLSLVKHNPVFGIGPDNFPKFFARYYKEEAKAMFPSSNGNLDKAHNEFLDVLLDNGIAGLTAYLVFFGGLLWYCFRRADKDKFAPVFGVAVFSYMAHAFFGYQLPIQSPVMWMMIGTAGAFARSEWLAAKNEQPAKSL